MRKTRVTLAIALASIVVTAGVLFFGGKPREGVRLTSRPDASLVPSAMNAFTPKEQSPDRSRVPMALSNITGPLAFVTAQNTLGSEYRRLAAGSIAQRYAAYLIVEECQWEHHRSDATFRQDLCADLAPGEYGSGEARLKLLIPAALAGEPGAWWRLKTREGPNGVFHTMPPGDEYTQLEAQAHDAALKAADPLALIAQVNKLAETDPAKALEVFAASRRAGALYYNRAPLDPATQLPDWAHALPADVKAQAIAAGEQFANQAVAQHRGVGKP